MKKFLNERMNMNPSFITDTSEVGSVTIRLEIGEIKGELGQKYNDTNSYNVYGTFY